jgi:hypothetical protein
VYLPTEMTPLDVTAVSSLPCIKQCSAKQTSLEEPIKIIMLRAIILFQVRPEKLGHPEQSPTEKGNMNKSVRQKERNNYEIL